MFLDFPKSKIEEDAEIIKRNLWNYVLAKVPYYLVCFNKGYNYLIAYVKDRIIEFIFFISLECKRNTIFYTDWDMNQTAYSITYKRKKSKKLVRYKFLELNNQCSMYFTRRKFTIEHTKIWFTYVSTFFNNCN